MTGPEAAALFYDADKFMRAGAAPEPLTATLFGKGGVQALDGEAHRRRKAMFLSIVPSDRVRALADAAAELWPTYPAVWATRDRVVLYEETQELLTRAVCAWAGVPLEESEVKTRTRELVALFDAAGSVSPRHLWARLSRGLAERWAGGLVEQIRAGRLEPAEDAAAHIIAFHREANGEPLSPQVAAVELLNVLRPTVAVAIYVVFAAHALHEHPECRDRLRGGDPAYADAFVQEVRRFYPFFPSTVARVCKDFDWKGYRFPGGTRVVLDLYGTNHDSRVWEAPAEFRPERFLGRTAGRFEFIPQGGGDRETGHRCPGEEIAVELTKVAADFLARLDYEVPAQDLTIDMTRLPALPKSRFVLANVRPALNRAWQRVPSPATFHSELLTSLEYSAQNRAGSPLTALSDISSPQDLGSRPAIPANGCEHFVVGRGTRPPRRS